MSLSKADKNLLLRIARWLREQAETVKRSHEPWTGAEGIEQKRRYDRMLREERDLQDLRRRLEAP